MLAAGAGVLAVAGIAGPAAASTAPDFEAPFPCGQVWSAQTRTGHSPSWYAIDFNRADDYRNAVLASAPGVVTTVSDLGNTSYGKYVVVDHGGGWSTLFAHLDAQWVVPGQRVDQGQLIGLLGTSGGSTGPHLHFEQRSNGTDQPAVFHGTPLVYNTDLRSHNCGDVPVVGDWSGRGRTAVGVFRRSKTSRFLLRRPGGASSDVAWGTPAAEPVTGDWNGNGVTDLGLWDPVTRTFSLRSARGKVTTVKYGRHKDVPVTGDWNGDGRTDVGVFRPKKGVFRLRASDGSTTRVRFGTVGSLPVTGDWNGNGTTDVATFDPATGAWRLRRDNGSARKFSFGAPGSQPVAGDWNGRGRTEVGVWSPRTATYELRRGRHGQRVQQISWGRHR